MDNKIFVVVVLLGAFVFSLVLLSQPAVSTLSTFYPIQDGGYLRDTNCDDSTIYEAGSENESNAGTSAYGSGYILQGYFYFNTSSIPDIDTASAAWLTYYVRYESIEDDMGTYLYSTNFGTSLTTADWNSPLGTNHGLLYTNGMATATYYDINISTDDINLTDLTHFTHRINISCHDAYDYVGLGDYNAPTKYAGVLYVEHAPAPTDTCTPPASGDWTVDCNDNCTLSDNTYLSGSMNLEGSGGNFTLGAAHLSMHDWNLTASACTIYLKSGSTFNITTQT